MKKRIITAIMALAALTLVPQQADAQFFKQLGKVAEKVGKSVLEQATQEVENTENTTETTTQGTPTTGETPKTPQNGTPTNATTPPAKDNPMNASGTKIITSYPDFKVEIIRCVQASTNLLIEMRVTNLTDEDIERMVVGGGREDTNLYDAEGNVFSGNNVKVKLANAKEFTPWNQYVKLVSHLPMKVTFMVEQYTSKATSIALFEPTFNIREWQIKPGSVKIRNLPIERQ